MDLADALMNTLPAAWCFLSFLHSCESLPCPCMLRGRQCPRLGTWRRELLWVSPGHRLLVVSPAGWAGCCRSLPVGFKNCINNFCCYFRKLLPKAVCITDMLSLQGMCGMAGVL